VFGAAAFRWRREGGQVLVGLVGGLLAVVLGVFVLGAAAQGVGRQGRRSARPICRRWRARGRCTSSIRACSSPR
jgi:hypothetical protein